MADTFDPSLKSAIKDLRTVVGLLKDTTKAIKDMSSATNGMVKAARGNKGSLGKGSQGMMDNALASFSGFNNAKEFNTVRNFLTPALGKFSGVGAAAIGNAPKILGGLNQMMPDFNATVDRATGYYNAVMAQGNRYGRASFESSVLKGLGGQLTSTGSDARVAEIMSGSGVAFSNSKSSFFQTTLRGVGNMAKYFNMSNESAASAMTSLSGGASSAMLMRNFGVMTSDTSGKQLSTGQIINQISSRLTAGRGKFTEKDVMDSFYKGNLGASLQASGLSQDQQQMVVQSLLAQAKGKTFDPSSDKAMEGAFSSGKNKNPTDFQRGIYGAQSEAMGKGESSYLAGAEAAGKAVEVLTKAGGELAKAFGGLTAATTVLTGSMAGAGALSVLSGLGGIAATGLMTAGKIPGLGGLGTLLSGGGAATAGGLGATAATAAVVAAPVAGTVMSAQYVGDRQTQYNYATGSSSDVSNIYNPFLSGKQRQDTNNFITENLGSTDFDKGLFGAQGPLFGKNGLFHIGGGKTTTVGVGGGDTSAAAVSSGTGANGAGTGKPFRLSKPIRSGEKPTAVFNQKKYQGKVIWPDGHNGIDYPVGVGSAVLASADGTVAAVSKNENQELGVHIIIKHPSSPGGKMHTLYAHLSGTNVSAGDSVTAGAMIGLSGKTGTKITGAHLHFALMTSASSADSINPAPYMDGIPAADPGDSGITPAGGTASADASASTTTSGGTTTTTPSAAATSDAVMVDSSGVKAQSNTISSQINNGANMSGGQTSSGTGVGGGDTAGIVSATGSGAAMASMSGTAAKRGNGNNVTINLTIAQANDDEARRFAKKVKQLLEEDGRRELMGRR